MTKGTKVGVVGLGGLGHVAVKIAKAMGAEVTVFSTSKGKEADAKRLGAKHFLLSTDAKNVSKKVRYFDLIIDSVSADHDSNPYLQSLRIDGTMVLFGVPPKPSQVAAFSLIGVIKETQEMLDFCTSKKVFSDIELTSANQINDAYEKTIKGQVKYRFVIDAKTF